MATQLVPAQMEKEGSLIPNRKLLLMFQLNAPVVMETEGSKQHRPQLSLHQRMELKTRLNQGYIADKAILKFKSNSAKPIHAVVFRLLEE